MIYINSDLALVCIYVHVINIENIDKWVLKKVIIPLHVLLNYVFSLLHEHLATAHIKQEYNIMFGKTTIC